MPASPVSESPAASPWPRVVAAALGGAAALGLVAAWWPAMPWLVAAAGAVVAALSAWRPAAADAAAPAVPPAVGDAVLRDAETGMFHRPAFLALAERDWQRAGRYGGEVALLLVEVDRLRQMTERSGPRVADALLAGLGRQVLASLRAADLLARFDDAQLAVFLPQADATGALDVADRVREMVEQLALPGLPDGAKFSASVGVAVLRPLHQPLTVLVGQAQQALQSARQAGGNCVRSANPDAPWPALRDAAAGSAERRERPARPGEN
jgi:diguanylate cyclase (GGDEF)-like protein